MKRNYRTEAGALFVLALALSGLIKPPNKSSAVIKPQNWIGTWAAAAQPSLPKVQTFHNQTLRLIVHGD